MTEKRLWLCISRFLPFRSTIAMKKIGTAADSVFIRKRQWNRQKRGKRLIRRENRASTQ
jgi:hypothetical protein